ncbi:S41 family peptidase [Arcticibacter svalbardensis]|uniref:S41 family peptidase n=1 Tax=Arcticibacter svalbardensis TaxID=1288027 RepID=UPI0005906D62|nr:S41 family peptidase [Arcticibacter svalbardensis]
MSTRKNLLIAACYTGALVLGMVLGPKFQKENNKTNNELTNRLQSDEDGGKLSQVLDLIKENYVDDVKLDTFQNLAINEILNHLDPHSAYLPPVEARQFSDDINGNYDGVGIEYQLLNDTLIITHLNSMGPAAKAGLQSGDQLLKIGTVNIAGTGATSKKIVELIRGRQGTLVNLTIRRYGVTDEIVYQVPRNKITISSIDVAYLLQNKIGYIKVSKFGAKTDEDFQAELIRLKKQGMKGLIVDLRENGGGYLNAATALADQFLPENKLIVYTQGQHEPRTDYFATRAGNYEQGKLVVLIDEGTASASEIIAGAIQDLDRGILVGRRSFGKGLVQEQFNFGDGSSLNLTVARYYTPSGRSIQKPYLHGKAEYFQEVSNRLSSGELLQDKEHLMSNLYSTKDKFFRTTSGRIVYGGGGIMPDIYVPVDTSKTNKLYYALSRKAVLNEYVYSYLIKAKRPVNLNSLSAEFNISNLQYKKLVALAKSKNIIFSAKEFDVARHLIMLDLKALLTRFYFGEAAYYHVLNEDDHVLLRSLKEFK